MKKIIECFPENNTPRPNQVKVLEQLQEAIDAKTKFIILQCPTGTGKSHIAATISNYSDSCNEEYRSLVNTNQIFKKTVESGTYTHKDEVMAMPRWGTACLTVSKQLQNQYDTLFQTSEILKGKGNYVCNLDPMFSADIAPCVTNWKIGEKCLLKDACTYYGKMKKTLTSKFQVYNYSKYLSMPSFVRRNQFLICDEASEVEEMVVGHFSTEINYKMLDYYKINYNNKVTTDNIHKNIVWLDNLKNEISLALSKAQSKSHTATYSKRDKERDIRIAKYCRAQIERINLVLKGYKVSDYVCDFDKDKVVFTPVYVHKLSQVLWNDHDHVILMSGTIFDVKTFTKSIGIKDYTYIEVDSEFDANKSPIYIPAKYTLNYNQLNTNLPKVIRQAEDIAEEFKDKNGIIHTHTNKITTEFGKRVKNKNRFLIREGHITNEHLIIEHSETDEPTVLVSPSMSMGVDLPGDLSEFQIIVKLPYLSLADKRVKKIFAEDKKWYTMKMFVKLIQMCGRSTRNETDECPTYILDKAAINIIKKEWSNLPEYFKCRLK